MKVMIKLKKVQKIQIQNEKNFGFFIFLFFCCTCWMATLTRVHSVTLIKHWGGRLF